MVTHKKLPLILSEFQNQIFYGNILVLKIPIACQLVLQTVLTSNGRYEEMSKFFIKNSSGALFFRLFSRVGSKVFYAD